MDPAILDFMVPLVVDNMGPSEVALTGYLEVDYMVPPVVRTEATLQDKVTVVPKEATGTAQRQDMLSSSWVLPSVATVVALAWVTVVSSLVAL